MNNEHNHKNPSASELLKKIQAIDFAKVETELYLDSHPECAVALDHYRSLCMEYDALVAQYENSFSPLTHKSAAKDTWTWVNMPWPWDNKEV